MSRIRWRFCAKPWQFLYQSFCCQGKSCIISIAVGIQSILALDTDFFGKDRKFWCCDRIFIKPAAAKEKTTGAGDAFCAGVSSGLTYGKTLAESVEIGTRLAASVITSSENVCPRFLPGELGIEA